MCSRVVTQSRIYKTDYLTEVASLPDRTKNHAGPLVDSKN